MSASLITPPGVRPKRKMSRTRAILMLAGGAVLLVVLPFYVLEAIFNPWAVSLTGAPTLTGEWEGKMTTASGRTFRLDLSLKRDLPTRECSNCPKISGEVRACEIGSECRTYRMWGDVDDRRGTTFLLKTLDESEHAGKLTLGYLTGRWPGADTLHLTTELRTAGASVTMRSEKDERGQEITRVIGGDPDTHAPVQWAMERKE